MNLDSIEETNLFELFSLQYSEVHSSLTRFDIYRINLSQIIIVIYGQPLTPLAK